MSSTWLTAIGTLIALAALITQFYFKWVPNVEDQKRHVKLTAMWVMDILTVGVQVVAIYLLAQFKGPVTPDLVVRVSIGACCLVLCGALITIRRLVLGYMRESLHDLGRLSGTNGHGAIDFGWMQQHVAVTQKIIDALDFLAKDPNLSAETVQAIRTILNGRPDKLTLPKTVDYKDTGALE